MEENTSTNVKNFMSGVLLHADRESNIVELSKMIFENNAHAIIVRDGGIPVGIVTSKDIIKSFVNYEEGHSRIAAHQIMSSPIVTIEHENTIHSARSLMMDTGLRKIPVKDGLDIIGLVVQGDLIRDLSWYRKE